MIGTTPDHLHNFSPDLFGGRGFLLTKMKKTDAPPDGKVDKHGFTIKPTISDEECLRICLSNAPCGIDKKQAERLIKNLG